MRNLILLQEGAATGGGFNSQLIMFGLIALVFYFFMIRPQMKRTKEARKFRDGLATGDKVVTSGGIHGKILEVADSTVLIGSEGSTKFRIVKANVFASVDDIIQGNKR